MAEVAEDEVVPSLVAHLDTSVLRSLGGCKTNAEIEKGVDRAVMGPHFFLVLEVDAACRACLAVPLFSKKAAGSQPLDETLKSGLGEGWIGKESRFSKWQHWRIPLGSMGPASLRERSHRGNRRRYAAGYLAALQEIARWQDSNRAPWRDV
jgi:hypothetical protein